MGVFQISKQCLCSHKDSKLRFTAMPETAVSACWGRTPNPVNSPVAGAGCAFVSRTLLFLRPRKRRSLRSPAKRKTGNPVLAAIIGLRQDWQGIVWTIPKSHPGVSANLQCPPHRCSRFRSPALRTGSDYRSIAGA